MSNERREDSFLTGAGEVSPVRLGQAVVDKISAAIVKGDLRPGDALPSEGRIAETFGISKQIAREAIRDLAAMGIIQIHQGKVARVKAPGPEPLSRYFLFATRSSPDGLANAIEMRMAMEPPIARFAAVRRSEADIERLRVAMAALEDSVGRGDWIDADLDFHEAVASAAHNDLFLLQARGLRSVAKDVMEFFMVNNPRERPEWEQFLDRHRQVVRAIEAGDAAQAFRCMELHFDAGRTALEMVRNRTHGAN